MTKGFVEQKVLPLGYRPFPDSYANAILTTRDSLIFDVTYTIDSSRLRTNPEPSESVSDAVIFMGCSFTFGVGDDETISWKVGIKGKEQFQVFNFGFPGYGPHQMLAALQFGLIDSVIGGLKPRHFVFISLPGHVWRVIGDRPWDHFGPRYVLGDTSIVRYTGAFHNSLFLFRFVNQLKKSKLIEKFLQYQQKPIDSLDVILMAKIIEQSKQIIKKKWPLSNFHVLLWDENSWITTIVEQELTKADVKHYSVESIIPGVTTDSSIYRFPVDMHPNAKAYSLLADYVYDSLIVGKKAISFD